MSMNAVSNGVRLRLGGDVLQGLQEAREQLKSAEGEIVLDFSAVRRIQPSGVAAMDKLARAAEEKGIRVVLDGVSVEIYKVLKLVKLAPRFSFGGM
jgi:ABC-type transporter Mla MlaB component